MKSVLSGRWQTWAVPEGGVCPCPGARPACLWAPVPERRSAAPRSWHVEGTRPLQSWDWHQRPALAPETEMLIWESLNLDFEMGLEGSWPGPRYGRGRRGKSVNSDFEVLNQRQGVGILSLASAEQRGFYQVCLSIYLLLGKRGKCGPRPLPLRHLWPRPERGWCLAVDVCISTRSAARASGQQVQAVCTPAVGGAPTTRTSEGRGLGGAAGSQQSGHPAAGLQASRVMLLGFGVPSTNQG